MIQFTITDSDVLGWDVLRHSDSVRNLFEAEHWVWGAFDGTSAIQSRSRLLRGFQAFSNVVSLTELHTIQQLMTQLGFGEEWEVWKEKSAQRSNSRLCNREKRWTAWTTISPVKQRGISTHLWTLKSPPRAIALNFPSPFLHTCFNTPD